MTNSDNKALDDLREMLARNGAPMIARMQDALDKLRAEHRTLVALSPMCAPHGADAVCDPASGECLTCGGSAVPCGCECHSKTYRERAKGE